MLSAVLVLVGSVAAWLLLDHLLSRRDERLQRGRAAWSERGTDRVFHSTGWEETIPPLEAIEPPSEGLRQGARSRATA